MDLGVDRPVPAVVAIDLHRGHLEEIAAMPAWLARSRDPGNPRTNVLKHNLAGMPGVAVMPQVLDAKRDWVVDAKKRYDCFIGTDLDSVLRTHGINTVFI